MARLARTELFGPGEIAVVHVANRVARRCFLMGDDTEVARRWLLLCPRRKNEDGSAAEPNECELTSIRHEPDRLAQIRLRLGDISWWMRLLCQTIAIRANREDGETGKFWQSRFRAGSCPPWSLTGAVAN